MYLICIIYASSDCNCILLEYQLTELSSMFANRNLTNPYALAISLLSCGLPGATDTVRSVSIISIFEFSI